jgi:acyl-CoA thioester hydrolase/1,4-dihydroxy-2-naphthoyl-CoA hydrolase
MEIPEKIQPFSVKVAFDEADSAGIVFFGNYFRFAHRALEHFLPQIGIAWDKWFSGKEIGVPLRHVEADYMRPIRPGEQLQIRTHIANVGESSVEFIFDFQIEGGSSAARVRTVHVFVATEPLGQKIQIPPPIKTLLEQHVK